ncbi:uncharacterized protein LOC141598865 [Silene latifolia]|uniref:uncharacterized protein LOC141598865 n=1 Tax=Silene latifolia TaxID=37657 RepID=UPI003D774209
MSAAQACPCHFLPKKCLGRSSLQKCTNRKRDNIVLIEVDSDDFGDVIILDVPESFHKKFKKKPKHVISLDDDDDDGEVEKRSGACNLDADATTSHRSSPTSVADSLNSAKTAKIDEDSVSEGKNPVNLSKSKRTYSDKNVSRNRYGLWSDDMSSSDSDCSDCEFMGDSSGRLNEQWEKTSFVQPKGSSCVSPEDKSGSSASSQPADNSAEEVKTKYSDPPGQQCETDGFLNDLAQKIDERNRFFQKGSFSTKISDLFGRGYDSCMGYSDPVDKDGYSVTDVHVYQSGDKKRSVDVSEPSNNKGCLNHEKNTSTSSAKVLAGQYECAPLDADAKGPSEACVGVNSANMKENLHLNVERSCPESFERETDNISLEDYSRCGHVVHDNEAKSAYEQNCVFTDRQKRKETDEYKRAMEEEWASRQKQIQLQAEEAQRLRSRKRAEKLRIMANEKRQMQRLEEVRETRRKDEENLNIKDQLRAEMQKELHKLEMCSDMASLLRCLGIHVGGGRFPSPNEIEAAYKRACLKFHPDRFGKSDLRQQVEAEEKFKLISTMKHKLLLKQNNNWAR